MTQKVVFITGASSGIGEAISKEYAHKGYSLVLLARRVDRLKKLEEELSKTTSVLSLECDVCKESDLKEAVEKTLKKFSRIDVVIANAGFGVAGRFEKLSLDDYRRQFET